MRVRGAPAAILQPRRVPYAPFRSRAAIGHGRIHFFGRASGAGSFNLAGLAPRSASASRRRTCAASQLCRCSPRITGCDAFLNTARVQISIKPVLPQKFISTGPRGISRDGAVESAVSLISLRAESVASGNPKEPAVKVLTSGVSKLERSSRAVWVRCLHSRKPLARQLGRFFCPPCRRCRFKPRG